MKDYADAGRGWQAKRARKSKRMKERKNTHDPIFRVQHENLVELLHVRSNVVVRQNDALGIAGRAAGKNNRGNVIQRGGSIATSKLRDHLCRQETGSQCRSDPLTEAWVLGHVLDENCLTGWLDFDFLQKNSRG